MQDINKPIHVAEYHILIPKAELQALVLSEINTPESASWRMIEKTNNTPMKSTIITVFIAIANTTNLFCE